MIGSNLRTATLQRALDGVWQRQKAISANIANQETPGYKAVRVSFVEALSQAVRTAETGMNQPERRQALLDQVGRAPIRAMESLDTAERLDGNNVNMELENIELAKTQIQYQFLTRGMTDYYARLRYAISEGKK